MRLVFILFLTVLSVSAQNADERRKFEIEGNYSFQRISKSGGFNDRSGFKISLIKNFSRYFGIKFDLGATFIDNDFATTAVTPPNLRLYTVRSELFTYLGGIQIKDNSKEKTVKPYSFFLAGAGNGSQKLIGNCPSDVQSVCRDYNFSKTAFGTSLGGGIDIKATKRISIRAIQADYTAVMFSGRTLHNFRLGAGIGFH